MPAMDSAVFLPERPAPGDPRRLEGAWRRLPDLRLDQADPAAAELFAAGTAEPGGAGGAAGRRPSSAKPQSAEARLRLADAMISTGEADVDAVMCAAGRALALDALRLAARLVLPGSCICPWAAAAEAVECFDKVYGEIPGETAPKLALAMALEMDGRAAEAAGLYDTCSRTDPALAAAAFGLARCRLAAGDRAGAVAALGRVPDSAAQSARRPGWRRCAPSRSGTPDEADLRQAAELLAALDRDDVARHEAEAAVALEAARQVEAGSLRAGGTPMFGVAVSSRTMRQRAEAALRACARLSADTAARIAYVDRANAVRPRTLV